MTNLKDGRDHHWWPKSLSKNWSSDPDNKINTISHRGYEKRYSPKAIGKTYDGHNIIFHSIWDSSFERKFDRSDNDFPELTRWLLSAVSDVREGPKPLQHDEHQLKMLAVCLSSLVARNPTIRNTISLTIESYGLTSSNNLIAANLANLHDFFAPQIENGGKFAIFFDKAGSFIFGDGFLHNFPATQLTLSDSHLLVPISPNIVVMWFRPTRYRTYPKIIGISGDIEDIEFINESIQVYSSEYIYYKEIRPTVLNIFSAGKHQCYPYHKPPYLEYMMQKVLDYRPN